jgi:hypothetical protein
LIFLFNFSTDLIAACSFNAGEKRPGQEAGIKRVIKGIWNLDSGIKRNL